MAFNSTAGQQAKLVVNFNGTNTVLAAINWTLNIDPKAKDVSNFRDGRFRKKTLQDATVTATVIHDADASEYLTANGGLVDGQVVTMYCFVGNSSSNTNYAYIVPSMITNVTPKNGGAEDVVQLDITTSLHNGTVTYPVV